MATLVLSLFFLIPFFYSGIHYERTQKQKIKTIQKFIKENQYKKNLTITDLGSGSGEILIELSKNFPNFNFVGYEINPILILFSKIKTISQKNIKFKLKNFWNINLNNFDFIIIFQFPNVMKKLENKIKKECKKKIIISNHWKFPNIKENFLDNDIYLYKI